MMVEMAKSHININVAKGIKARIALTQGELAYCCIFLQ